MITVLSNACVYREGKIAPADIVITDGVISAFSEPGTADKLNVLGSSDIVFDFSNKYIFPGFSDVHVHFREPGFFYKESIKTGSEAAAAGGYTDVCTMPNLKPVPDSLENLKAQTDIIEKDAVIRVHPYGSLSCGEIGTEAADIDGMETHSIPPVAYSDDGVGLVSDELMRQALITCKKYDKIIAAHCEYKTLMGGNSLNDGPAADAAGIKGISNESEWKMVERDINLLKETGGKYHVCHVSTKESVDIIRKAKAEGINVTCETGPHYLIYNDENVAEAIIAAKNGEETGSKYGIGRFKMNPPIRSEADRQALITGIKDGTIDMIATDHAPHGLEEKNLGIDGPMGVTGLECAFPTCYTYLVKTGVITLEELIKLMSDAPAKRFGFDNEIAIGKHANLTVFDLEEEYIIDPDEFKTKGRFTPFDGCKVNGRCLMTICDGNIVYKR